tara:strand:+ start:157 stop:1236 length:1080 start_codon:yes stop_codon:yes gene_type:complete
MPNQVVYIPCQNCPIKPSPGFDKKDLANHHLEIMGWCGYACTYCSSPWGNYLRINRKPFADITEEQLGQRSYPSTNPDLTFQYPDFVEKLELQLADIDKSFGKGNELVFSQLTDGFSSIVVGNGKTRYALDRILEKTSFTIRVMTKNAVVGTDRWIRYFLQHKDRFIIGLSIGTTNDDWQRQVELGTSSPSARIKAINKLIDAGVRTYAMVCPVFPHVLQNGMFEDLLDQLNIPKLEHVWTEPYNDRANWERVHKGLDDSHPDKEWLHKCYQEKKYYMWSDYASELYERILKKAESEGWEDIFTYLLYEAHIDMKDVPRFGDLHGILLQTKKGEDGYSKHPEFRNLQLEIEAKGYKNAG